jgi:hypothetical protein
VVEVVREPDAHAARRGVDEGGANEVARLAREAEVVEREVEAPACLAEERGDGSRDVQRGLAPVGQRPELERVSSERVYCPCALSFAL